MPLPECGRSSPSASSAFEVRERHYDLVVVDSPATGHVVGQLASPRRSAKWSTWASCAARCSGCRDLAGSGDDRRRHRDDARGDAGDRDDRAHRADSAATCGLAAVVVNQVLPELFTREEEPLFDRLRRPAVTKRWLQHAGRPGVGRARRRGAGDHPARSSVEHVERSAGSGPASQALFRIDLPAGLVRSAAPTRRRAATASARSCRSRPRSPTSSASRPPARSNRCCRPRRSSSTCGSGGVGKTTTGGGAAAMAAVHLDGRVLALTVDPARASGQRARPRAVRQRRAPRARRAAFADAGRATPVVSCGSPCSTPRRRGTSSSANTHPTRHTRDAILANPLYATSPAKFVHSHDYIAMERLHDIHSSGRYDLIVVDTRRRATPSTSSTRPTAWPTSSAVGCCAG